MQLQDMENEILSNLQQTPLVNFGQAPNWNAATNPEFDKPTIDHWISRGYLKVMRDVEDLDVALFSATFLSTAQTYRYSLNPVATTGATPNPPVGAGGIQRLFYTPQGQPTLEFEPGIKLIPWKEFQRYTVAGWFQPSSYGPYPEWASVSPDRQWLYFWPGCASAGDSIEVQYVPIVTAGTLVAPLANETDTPYFNEDFHDLIVTWAMAKLYPKARAMNAKQVTIKEYYDELLQLRAKYEKRSGGDKQRITDVWIDRMSAGPFWP